MLDDADVRRFVLKAGGSRISACYEALPPGPMRVALWRYLALYERGGLYADIDTTCNVALDSWLPADARLVLAKADSGCFYGSTLAAAPGHPALGRIIDLVCRGVEQGIESSEQVVRDFIATEGLGALEVEGTYVYPSEHFDGAVVTRHSHGDLARDADDVGLNGTVVGAAAGRAASSAERVFGAVYRAGAWGTVGTSGPGATSEYCAPLVRFLCDYIRTRNVRTVCDVGCGDLGWMPLVIQNTGVRYVGVDCVLDLIEAHKSTYPSYAFIHCDISADPAVLPDADLYLVKDVLQHWPSEMVEQWLRRFFDARPSADLLVANCRAQPHARDVALGGFVPLDGSMYPLRLFGPEELFRWRSKTLYRLRPAARRLAESPLLSALAVRDTTAAKLRLGRAHDGGYVVCAIGAYDGFLSAGIGSDASFEEAVLALHDGLVCHAYDPHIAPQIRASSRLRLHRDQVSSLPGGRNLLVKVDIEGGEYEWFGRLSDEQLGRIKQLVVEIHHPFDSERRALLERLAQKFDLVHLHGNNYSGTRVVAGVTVPDVLEATYVRKGEIDARPASYLFVPTPIDMPNNASIPDLHCF